MIPKGSSFHLLHILRIQGIEIRLFISFICSIVFSQLTLLSQEDYSKYVNPFIGTGKTKVKSMWGTEGGTYPGAVAPFGYVQLTPETNFSSSKGYNYNDSSIFFFSCVNHMSGYPDGSAGSIYVMPVEVSRKIQIGKYSRPFFHQDEKAQPGYYSVLFRDNGTLTEVSSSARTGMFRFTFPPSVTPVLYLGDAGKIEVKTRRLVICSEYNAVINFSEDISMQKETEGGVVLTFASRKDKKLVLIMKIGVSTTSQENSVLNLEAEAATWDFDEYKEKNKLKWKDALSIIEVDDPSDENKIKFYTALYHSSLLPWIISDVNGEYLGADRKIHCTKGSHQYGGFSPWDTFRSLHPLLCLIAPERQNDMILSLLDHYDQTGRLPQGPMTGYHALAIIADSWFKDIKGFDSLKAYSAMKATLCDAMKHADYSAYMKKGYVPSIYAESVTKTVEYAYNDWVIARFAGKILKYEDESGSFLKRSFNYRNLFFSESMFLLPRNEDRFFIEPGNFGYKEGDKWSYSLFVPHNPSDLVNLKGGKKEFTAHLESAFAEEKIYFDNEPVLHVPYLFNYAGSPFETQKWVRKLMNSHYRITHDGLPGNDDLGAMSSWFVFSAAGFFPVCPGNPVYDIGSPLFEKLTFHLANGKDLIIRSQNNKPENCYIKNLLFNGKPYGKSRITHSAIKEGSELVFIMDSIPGASLSTESEENDNQPDFSIREVYTSKKQVKPDEKFYVKFRISNSGSAGTKILKLYTDGCENFVKNIFLNEGSSVSDSIECRLYPVGKRKIRLDNLDEIIVEVVQPKVQKEKSINVSKLNCTPIFKAGEYGECSYSVHNSGGYADSSTIQVLLNDSIIFKDLIVLSPGERKRIHHRLKLNKPGIYSLSADAATIKFKVYVNNNETGIIDMPLIGEFTDDIVSDLSGFSNNGIIVRTTRLTINHFGYFKTCPDSYIEISNSPSLDMMGERITVMAWIYPEKGSIGLTDIITKGDFIALQTNAQSSLSFFAGGWGRGSCEIPLPPDWVNKWHHVAGVSDGHYLRIYINGVESGSNRIETPVNLSTSAKWMIGRNEEFPGERIFLGFVSHFRIFAEALTSSEIIKEMNKK